MKRTLTQCMWRYLAGCKFNSVQHELYSFYVLLLSFRIHLFICCLFVVLHDSYCLNDVCVVHWRVVIYLLLSVEACTACCFLFYPDSNVTGIVVHCAAPDWHILPHISVDHFEEASLFPPHLLFLWMGFFTCEAGYQKKPQKTKTSIMPPDTGRHEWPRFMFSLLR